MSQKVVVVDDDPTNVGLLKMLLELDGFYVEACTTIEKAKTVLDSSTNAFVIDCHLSRGTNGNDLLRDIRAGNTNAPKNSIVIMTSGDHRLSQESIDLGASQFLLKPYPPERLSIELASLLRGN